MSPSIPERLHIEHKFIPCAFFLDVFRSPRFCQVLVFCSIGEYDIWFQSTAHFHNHFCRSIQFLIARQLHPGSERNGGLRWDVVEDEIVRRPIFAFPFTGERRDESEFGEDIHR